MVDITNLAEFWEDNKELHRHSLLQRVLMGGQVRSVKSGQCALLGEEKRDSGAHHTIPTPPLPLFAPTDVLFLLCLMWYGP